MTHQEMHDFAIYVWSEEILPTLDQAQTEYAHGATDDAHNAFKRVATALNTSPEKALMTYALKHIDGVTAWINGLDTQREPIQGRIKDVIIYMLLLWSMIGAANELSPLDELTLKSLVQAGRQAYPSTL